MAVSVFNLSQPKECLRVSPASRQCDTGARGPSEAHEDVESTPDGRTLRAEPNTCWGVIAEFMRTGVLHHSYLKGDVCAVESANRHNDN